MRELFIYGANGHAKVIIDIVQKQKIYRLLAVFDDDENLNGKTINGYPIMGGKEALKRWHKATKVTQGLVAIGNNGARREVVSMLKSCDFELITAIHPSAQIAAGATIGKGSVIMAGAVINSDASIGENVIINTGANVDHDCLIENNVHIAPGSTTCGGVSVGDDSFIGAGAVIIPNIVIGRNVIVGAGAIVIRDIPDDTTVVGCPAKA